MAIDMFLKIDGIQGESTDTHHSDEIDILSYTWGESQPGTASSGTGAAAGRVTMQDFHFTMRVNRASPRLFLAWPMERASKTPFSPYVMPAVIRLNFSNGR